MYKYITTKLENGNYTTSIESTLLSDKLKEISEKQWELFDMKAVKLLNDEALVKLFRMSQREIEIRNLHHIYSVW